MPKAEKHAHKLKRHTFKTTGARIFFCILPDCHYRIATHLALGKRSICNRCGEEFIMNELAIRLAKPHCLNCSVRKGEVNTHKAKPISVSEINEVIKGVADEVVSGLSNKLSSISSGLSVVDDKIEEVQQLSDGEVTSDSDDQEFDL